MTINHEEENSAFETIVKDNRDPVAMITYCFYKLEKIKYFKDNPQLDDSQKHATCRVFIAPDSIERIKRDARDALRSATQHAVEDYKKSVKPKVMRWGGIFEGVISGIIITLVAPFVWLSLYHLLRENDLWKPFVDWINSIPKN